MNKKGALELSINAIVILILGVTILGLAIAFMTNIFGAGTEEFTRATGSIEKQFIDQLKLTRKSIDVDTPKFALKAPGSNQIFIAFNNKEASPKSFTIDGLATTCTRLGGTPACTGVTVEYKTSATSVAAGEVTVQPMNFKADTTAVAGTYLWEIMVDHGTVDNERVEVIVDVT